MFQNSLVDSPRYNHGSLRPLAITDRLLHLCKLRGNTFGVTRHATDLFSPALISSQVSPGIMNLKPLDSCEVIKAVKNKDSLGTMPEGGDASINITHVPNNTKLDGRRSKEFENHAKDLFPNTQMSQCPLLRLSNKLSSSVIDTALYSHAGLVERGVLGFETQADLLSLGSTGFPYYRSYKSCGGFQDIVLVKDAGISCTLLDPGKNTSKTSGRSSTLLEAFLLNQLKIECSDISEITRKLSSYTKDILQSLSLRKKRKDDISISDLRPPREESNSSSTQPVAMQYVDKTGRPCLKLRLVESTKLFTPMDSRQNSWWNLAVPRKERKLMKTTNLIVGKELTHKTRKVTDQRDEPMTERAELLMENKKVIESCEIPWPRNQNRKSKDPPRSRVKQVRQLYPEEPATAELESSTCSSSSIYNFLMMRNRRTLGKNTTEKMKCSRFRIYGSPNDRFVIPKSSNKHRPRKGIAKNVAYDPIDSCRDSANANTENKLLTSQKACHSVQFCKKAKNTDQRSWLSVTANDGRFLPVSKSQAVNIRIVRYKRGM